MFNNVQEPRAHHYAFAHIALKEICAADPVKFFAVMVSPSQREFLDRICQLVCKEDQKAAAELNPDTVRIDTLRLKDYPVILVQMPQPQGITEAHMVAIVLLADLTADETPEQAEFRYFTLELGANMDGSERTVLCEWKGSTHANMGDGPPADPRSFLEQIEGMI